MAGQNAFATTDEAPTAYGHDTCENGIFSMLAAMEETISYIESHVLDMAGKLEPILGPDFPDDPGNSVSSVNKIDTRSPVARRLGELNDRLIIASNRLNATKLRVNL